jgi:ABC-type transport system involved in cytochrome bd biosynthesis fused ATPase/permease subunit
MISHPSPSHQPSSSLRFIQAGVTNEINLKWDNIDKFVQTSDTSKQVLHSLSGIAYPGQFIALMGPSGCGSEISSSRYCIY